MSRLNNSATGNKGLNHLNGNVMCAIDTETTGLEAGFHDIVEIAVIPLGDDLRIMKDVPPFHCLLKPKRPENISQEAMSVNKLDMSEIMLNGIDPWNAADYFDDWFQKKLKLAPGKKICPLGKNWPFDKGFIYDWLTAETFNQLFSHHYRDVGPTVLFLNDRADFQNEKPPFPKFRLTDIATTLDVPINRAHRALEDALVTAECYRRLMRVFIK